MIIDKLIKDKGIGYKLKAILFRPPLLIALASAIAANILFNSGSVSFILISYCGKILLLRKIKNMIEQKNNLFVILCSL